MPHAGSLPPPPPHPHPALVDQRADVCTVWCMGVDSCCCCCCHGNPASCRFGPGTQSITECFTLVDVCGCSLQAFGNSSGLNVPQILSKMYQSIGALYLSSLWGKMCHERCMSVRTCVCMCLNCHAKVCVSIHSSYLLMQERHSCHWWWWTAVTHF